MRLWVISTKQEGLQICNLHVPHLPSINVCHDTNVSVCVQRYLSRNCSQQSSRIRDSNKESLLCGLEVPLPEAEFTLNAWAAGRPLHLP